MVFTFTPGQLLTAFLAVCAAIVSVSAAASAIGKAIHAAKAPNDEQNKRLADLEMKGKAIDKMLDTDKKRLDELEEGNRITQRALLALLGHALDGNNVEQLKNAKDDLQDFLINR